MRPLRLSLSPWALGVMTSLAVSCGPSLGEQPASVFPPTGAADPKARGLCPMAGVTLGDQRLRVTLRGDALFDTDKSDLKPAALDILGQIKATVIDAHPDASIRVEGHTDDRASVDYNQGLSERRAASVAAWMEGKGVAAARISQRGYGKLHPRVPNTSDANRALNRRVELVLVWGDGGGAKPASACPTVQACCDLATLEGKPAPDPACIGKEPGPDGWGSDLGARGLEDTAGVLRLNPCLTTRSASIWVTSTGENKIARLEESDGKEAFRVPTHGRFPQRTAVAADGSVWVTNRDSGAYIHISGDGKPLCSSPEKTCMTRAAAIDSRGFAWIGCFDSKQLIQVSPTETDGTVEVGEGDQKVTLPRCKEIARVPTPEVAPYGLAADRAGGLWTGVNTGSPVVKVDSVERRVTLTVDPRQDPMLKEQGGSCWSPYGIGIDRDGNPWYANMGCGDVVKLDGKTGRVLGVWKGGPEGLKRPRALGFDRQGHAWVSENGGVFVDELAGDGAFLRRVDTSSCGKGAGPLGTASDSQGNMWTVIENAGKVMKYRTDGTILGCYPDQGTPPFHDAYIYSDFTGAAMEMAGSDKGVSRVRFQNDKPVRWRLASWKGMTPAGTALCVRARSAATTGALDAAPWSEVTCPTSPAQAAMTVALDGSRGGPTRVPDGAALEVELSLSSSDPAASPLLSGLSVAATPAGR